MDRRLLATVVVAVLAVLAGCSLSGGGDTVTPAPVVTPAPIPDAQTTAQPAPGSEFVDADAVERARRIAARHRTALGNRTYRVRERFDWSRTGADTIAKITNRTATTLYAPDGRVVHDRSRYTERLRTGESTWTNTSTYSDGTRRYIRTVTAGATTFDIAPATSQVGRVRPNVTRTVAQLLAVREANVTETTVDGEPGYRLVGQGSATNLYNSDNDYTVRALVQENGLVRRLEMTYWRSSLGVIRQGTYVVEIDPAPNATVERPSWVEQARAATDDASYSTARSRSSSSSR